MKKYVSKVRARIGSEEHTTLTKEIEVEAENKKEAKAKLFDKMSEGTTFTIDDEKDIKLLYACNKINIK